MSTATKSAPKGTRTTVRPLGDKILVKRDEAATKTDSGIFLPETSKDKPKTGTIEAVGTGNLNTDTGERIPLTVKKGDRVIFTSYAKDFGSIEELKIGNDEFIVMTEEHILAVID